MPTDLGDSAMRERREQICRKYFPDLYGPFRGETNSLVGCEALREVARTRLSLLAEEIWQAAQLTPEQIEELARRLAEIPIKPRCLDCNLAGMTNCSEFDRCAGRWVYRLSEKESAGVLREYLGGQR